MEAGGRYVTRYGKESALRGGGAISMSLFRQEMGKSGGEGEIEL